MKERHKEALLESVVAGAVSQLDAKLRYWQGNIDIPTNSNWEPSSSLSLPDVLQNIDGAEAEGRGGDFLLYYCIGWEYVWGEPPPKVVSKEREKLLARAYLGKPLGQLEKIWLGLIQVDTDMF